MSWCARQSGKASRASIVHRDRRRSGWTFRGEGGGGRGRLGKRHKWIITDDVALPRPHSLYKRQKKRNVLAQTLRITIAVCLPEGLKRRRGLKDGKTTGTTQTFPFCLPEGKGRRRRRRKRGIDDGFSATPTRRGGVLSTQTKPILQVPRYVLCSIFLFHSFRRNRVLLVRITFNTILNKPMRPILRVRRTFCEITV